MIRNMFSMAGLISRHYLRQQKNLMEKYDVRAVDEKQSIGSLSGGNQQKMVLSREVEKDSDFILVCQPVRGLDIGAINYIHEILLELRNQGKSYFTDFSRTYRHFPIM